MTTSQELAKIVNSINKLLPGTLQGNRLILSTRMIGKTEDQRVVLMRAEEARIRKGLG